MTEEKLRGLNSTLDAIKRLNVVKAAMEAPAENGAVVIATLRPRAKKPEVLLVFDTQPELEQAFYEFINAYRDKLMQSFDEA